MRSYEDKLREAFASGLRRCGECGLINDHRDDCPVSDLLASMEADLERMASRTGVTLALPLPAPDPTPPPRAIIASEPGFLAPRYVDVRPRWVQRLARWCRCRLRDLGLYP